MKILHMSDTHNTYPDINELPKVDLLIHSGDHSFLPKSYKNSLDLLRGEFEELNEYFKHIKDSGITKEIIYVCGNHDFIFENFEISAKEILKDAIVLIDESVTINGFKIYGTPHTPEFCDWAFNTPKDRMNLVWDLVPMDTDILVTHGPPHGVLDVVEGRKDHLGCPELRKAVNRVKPFLHCFGHIHSGNGMKKLGKTIFSNASIMNERYNPTLEYRVIKVKK